MALDNSSDASALAAWRVHRRWPPVGWVGSIDVVIARSFAYVKSVEGCRAVCVCGVASEDHMVSHKSKVISVFLTLVLYFKCNKDQTVGKIYRSKTGRVKAMARLGLIEHRPSLRRSNTNAV